MILANHARGCCVGTCQLGEFEGAVATTEFDITLTSFADQNISLAPYGFPGFFRHLQYGLMNGTWTVTPILTVPGTYYWGCEIGPGYVTTDTTAGAPTSANAKFWLYMLSNFVFDNLTIYGGFSFGSSSSMPTPPSHGSLFNGFAFTCLGTNDGSDWNRVLSSPPALGAYTGNVSSVVQS